MAKKNFSSFSSLDDYGLTSPDPTINSKLSLKFGSGDDDTEDLVESPTLEIPPEPVPAPITPKPHGKSTKKTNRKADPKPESKATKVILSKNQIFHRPSDGGLALGEPVKASRVADDESSEE